MSLKKIMRDQLDDQFKRWRSLRRTTQPYPGWVKLIRTALGMTTYQLAARLGVNQSRVIKMESATKDHSIKINTLERIAEAMECELVFALVPKTSLKDTLHQQARKRAEQEVMYVAHSMRLEDQTVAPAEIEHEIEQRTKELLDGPLSKLWNDD